MKLSVNIMKSVYLYFAFIVISPTLLGAQAIFVYATDVKQKIDMMGGDMERSSKAVQNIPNTEDVIQWGFGDINFNYCRVEFDKNQELTEGVKNWAFYDKQVATMKQIKAINPDIKFYATMRSDYNGYKMGNRNNLPTFIYDYAYDKTTETYIGTKSLDLNKYAIFLADYLEYMHNQGLTIHTLATHKEWSAVVNAAKSRDIINKLKTECASRNVPMPEMNDPGSWSMAAGLSFMKSVANLGTQDLYAGFSSHEYASNDTPEQEWPVLVAQAASMGKKLYQDETITGTSTDGVAPTYRYAQRAVLYQSGLSGEIFFEIWNRGISSEVRAINWKNNGTAYKLNGYYIMKHFANTVVDNYYVKTTLQNVIDGGFSAKQYGGVSTMAFRKGKVMTLWVINHTSAKQSTVDYPEMSIKVNSPIASNVQRRYWHEDVGIEGPVDMIVPTSAYEFKADIKENSINAFTFYVNDNVLSIDENEEVDNRMFIDTVVKNELLSEQDIQSYHIINLNGTVLKSGDEYTSSIDVSNLPTGVYIIQGYTSEQKMFTQKFIKQ